MDNLIKSKIQSVEDTFVNTMNQYESKLENALTGTSSTHSQPSEIMQLAVELKKFKAELMQYVAALKETLIEMDQRLDNQEAYSRKNCLIFHGIAELEEDVCSVMLTFFKERLGLANIGMNNIDNCHRLGSKSTPKSKHRDRPIIVKFTTYIVRHSVWGNKKMLKGTRYVISESLTKKRLEMYKKAQEIFSRRSTWTQDGRICVLLSNGKKKTITCEPDLEEAVVDFKEHKSASASVKISTHNLRSARK
ncbi:hypothetical protein PPYR_09049 [Photinus pyralis]|uniref:Uncharacterized protein n=2 Tax=Photinus pyralis TaxID=7054 RepID=A0A5N4AL75_PHOPY|nr:hypothetical protein PPYR_09049 [Photinus pyralis]